MKTRWYAASNRLGITRASPARITNASAVFDLDSRRASPTTALGRFPSLTKLRAGLERERDPAVPSLEFLEADRPAAAGGVVDIDFSRANPSTTRKWFHSQNTMKGGGRLNSPSAGFRIALTSRPWLRRPL